MLWMTLDLVLNINYIIIPIILEHNNKITNIKVRVYKTKSLSVPRKRNVLCLCVLYCRSNNAVMCQNVYNFTQGEDF